LGLVRGHKRKLYCKNRTRGKGGVRKAEPKIRALVGLDGKKRTLISGRGRGTLWQTVFGRGVKESRDPNALTTVLQGGEGK